MAFVPTAQLWPNQNSHSTIVTHSMAMSIWLAFLIFRNRVGPPTTSSLLRLDISCRMLAIYQYQKGQRAQLAKMKHNRA